MPGTSAFEVEADARAEGDQQKKQMIFGGIGVVVVIAVIIGLVSVFSGKKDLKLYVAEVKSFENDFKDSFVLTDPKKGTNQVGGDDKTKKQQHPDVVGLNVRDLLAKLADPMSTEGVIKDGLFKSDYSSYAVIATREVIVEGFVNGALCDGRDFPRGQTNDAEDGKEGPDRADFNKEKDGLFSGMKEVVLFVGESRPNIGDKNGVVKTADGTPLEYRAFFPVIGRAAAKTLQKKLEAKGEKEKKLKEVKKFLEGNLLKRSEVEVLSKPEVKPVVEPEVEPPVKPEDKPEVKPVVEPDVAPVNSEVEPEVQPEGEAKHGETDEGNNNNDESTKSVKTDDKNDDEDHEDTDTKGPTDTKDKSQVDEKEKHGSAIADGVGRETDPKVDTVLV